MFCFEDRESHLARQILGMWKAIRGTASRGFREPCRQTISRVRGGAIGTKYLEDNYPDPCLSNLFIGLGVDVLGYVVWSDFFLGGILRGQDFEVLAWSKALSACSKAPRCLRGARPECLRGAMLRGTCIEQGLECLHRKDFECLRGTRLSVLAWSKAKRCLCGAKLDVLARGKALKSSCLWILLLLQYTKN